MFRATGDFTRRSAAIPGNSFTVNPPPRCFRISALAARTSLRRSWRAWGYPSPAAPDLESLKQMLRRRGYRFFFEETVRTPVVLTDALESTVALTDSPGWRRESLRSAVLLQHRQTHSKMGCTGLADAAAEGHTLQSDRL